MSSFWFVIPMIVFVAAIVYLIMKIRSGATGKQETHNSEESGHQGMVKFLAAILLGIFAMFILYMLSASFFGTVC